MKNRSFAFPLACLALVNFAQADTITLNDGTKLEAKIVKETPETYELLVQVTKSIKDERVIKKSDVKSIEQEKLDEVAFEKIKNLVPTPDLLNNDDYDKRILAVVAFIKDYPKSARTAEANSMLVTLKAEGSAILSGGMKLGGVVISKADYLANQYELDARVIEAKARELIAKSDYVGALRAINRIETNFRSTASYAALMPLKKQAVKSLKAQVTDQLATFDSRAKERTAGLSRMTGADRTNTERALAEEDAAFEKLYSSEKAANQIWGSTNPNHKESLEDALATIETAESEAPVPAEADGGKRYRKTWELIQKSDDVDAIREAISAVESLEVPEKYIKTLQKAAEAKGVTF